MVRSGHPGMEGFNEVAPFGASATIAEAGVVQQLGASTKSLPSERVPRCGATFIPRDRAQLQRSRSLRSECHRVLEMDTLPAWWLQRSRSLRSECHKRSRPACPLRWRFNEVAPFGASATAHLANCRQSRDFASTKSLPSERVPHFSHTRLIPLPDFPAPREPLADVHRFHDPAPTTPVESMRGPRANLPASRRPLGVRASSNQLAFQRPRLSALSVPSGIPFHPGNRCLDLPPHSSPTV